MTSKEAEIALQSGAYAAVVDRLKPSTPHDQTLIAQALCFLGREDEAFALIKSIPSPSTAHELLARHYASRAAVVAKLNLTDSVGQEAGQVLKGHPSFASESRLAATLIVKNEEERLEACIESILPVADDIVIIDTGSTDGTVALIQRLKRKHHQIQLGFFEWCDDFSAARNAALDFAREHTTAHWALWIDADERLKEGGEGEIRQALIRPYFGGFSLRIVNFVGNEKEESTAFTHAPLRLFRLLPETRFTGKIHEQVTDSILAQGLPLGQLGSATLLHEGYLDFSMEQRNKAAKYTAMLEQEVRENPKDAYQWFNLANAYCIDGRLAETEHAARMSVRCATQDFSHIENAYQLLAGSETGQGKPLAALQTVEEARKKGLTGLFTEFEAANALMLTGAYDQALEAIDRSLSFEWNQFQTGDRSLFTFKRHVVKGQILTLTGKYEEALDYLDYALAVCPTFANAKFYRAMALEGSQQFGPAAELYGELVDDPQLATAAFAGEGRCLMAEGNYVAAASVFYRAWESSPGSYSAWADWAKACELSGDLDSVVACYQAFAQANEMTPELFVNWGRALDATGKSERALECFTEAIKLAPDQPNSYFNAGDLLYRLNFFEDAAHIYRAGLNLMPNFPSGWFVLGNCLAQMGVLAGAEIAYREALKLEPNYADAQKNLDTVLELVANAA